MHRVDRRPDSTPHMSESSAHLTTVPSTMPLLDIANDCSDASAGSTDDDKSAADAAQVAKKNKRRLQTDKARTQRFKNLTRKQTSSIAQDESDKRNDWASEIQKNYFTDKFYSVIQRLKDEDLLGSSGDYKRLAVERSRAVMSLLVQVVMVFARMLAPQENSGFDHVLECVVLDDSSCHLRNQNDGTPSIYTVMNTVQTVHVSYANKKSISFAVPTPMVCLQTQKTGDLHMAYTSHLLLSSQGVGKSLKSIESSSQYQALQVERDNSLERLLAGSDAWKCQVLVGDALPTNDAVFKRERQMLSKDKASLRRRLCLRIKCQLHQLCLVRKPAVLSVERFWTTLVRLGHLFEQHSFKRQLALATIQIFKIPGAFHRT